MIAIRKCDSLSNVCNTIALMEIVAAEQNLWR